jgi:hypothetical protein
VYYTDDTAVKYINGNITLANDLNLDIYVSKKDSEKLKLLHRLHIHGSLFCSKSLYSCGVTFAKFICVYLNINSLRYKFCHICELLTINTIDMLFLAETKIDDQFPVNNYHFWRADRTAYGGGIADSEKLKLLHRLHIHRSLFCSKSLYSCGVTFAHFICHH